MSVPEPDALAEPPAPPVRHRRVAAAYTELLTPRQFNLTTFPNEEGYDELVLAG